MNRIIAEDICGICDETLDWGKLKKKDIDYRRKGIYGYISGIFSAAVK